MTTVFSKSAVIAALAMIALASPAATGTQLAFPLERTAYFVGEKVPLTVNADVAVNKLEAVNDDGRVLFLGGQTGRLAFGHGAARVGPILAGTQRHAHRAMAFPHGLPAS